MDERIYQIAEQPSNSRGLKSRLERMLLQCHLKNG